MQTSSQTIARAHVYSFLAKAFSYPSQQVVQELEKELPSIPLSMSEIDRNAALLQAIEALQQAFKHREYQQLQREYSQLSTGREQCRLNEGDYEKASATLPQRLADISAFYLAFGLQVAPGTGERLDFISTEADFLHALLLKRRHAEQQGWAEQADICIKAEAGFLKEHILWWMPKLAQMLIEHGGFYGALGSLLLAFLQKEQAHCGDG